MCSSMSDDHRDDAAPVGLPPTVFLNTSGNISFYVPNTLMLVTGGNSQKNNFALNRGVSYGMVLYFLCVRPK